MSTKKVWLVFVFLMMLLSIPGPHLVDARSNITPPTPPDIPDFAKDIISGARLTNANNANQSYLLVPRFVEAVRTGDDSFAVTYEVGIPSIYLADTPHSYEPNELFPSVALASYDSHNGCDSTVSVCATVTLYYTSSSDHGYYQYMTGKWIKSDSTVTWSNAQLKAGCNAEWYTKSGRCLTQTTKSIGTPTSGTPYNYTPTSIAGSTNQVYLNDLNGIAAYQTITLKRGTSTWSFGFCVNQGGGSVILGCY